jgi:hypothetical protein
MLHMLQWSYAYVVRVCSKYSVSDVCCTKYFKLQMFHDQAQEWAQAEVVSVGTSVPACGEAKRMRQQQHVVATAAVACAQAQQQRTGGKSCMQPCIRLRVIERESPAACGHAK